MPDRRVYRVMQEHINRARSRVRVYFGSINSELTEEQLQLRAEGRWSNYLKSNSLEIKAQ